MEIPVADEAVASLDHRVPRNLKIASEFTCGRDSSSRSQCTCLHQFLEMNHQLHLQGSAFVPIEDDEKGGLFGHVVISFDVRDARAGSWLVPGKSHIFGDRWSQHAAFSKARTLHAIGFCA